MRGFSFRGFSKRIASLGSFGIELFVYAGLVTAYLLLVLHFLGDWIKEVFDYSKIIYALLALTLILAQGALLEMLTRVLLLVIERTKATVPVVRRLVRPHETVTRPTRVPGLLVYRFAGPLLFFNTAHFAHRVQELVDNADPPVIFLLINAEAIIDMDTTGVEVLEELYDTLESKNIALGLCEVKGHFQEVLMGTRLPRRAGFKMYPSVAATVQELMAEQLKDKKAGTV